MKRAGVPPGRLRDKRTPAILRVVALHYFPRSRCCLACLRLAAAPPPLDSALDSLSALHEFREVALSPDHAQVAWIETSPGKSDRRTPQHSVSVYIKDLRDSSLRQAHRRSGAQGARVGMVAGWPAGIPLRCRVARPDAVVRGGEAGARQSPQDRRFRRLRRRSALVAGRQEHRRATDRRHHARSRAHAKRQRPNRA